MKSQKSDQTQTQRNAGNPLRQKIAETELFPPINYKELQQKARAMIHEFAAHSGSSTLHVAIRTPAHNKVRKTRSLQAGWGEFWNRGRGIAFARRHSARTQRLIEYAYFGDKQKLAVFTDMAEEVWRSVVPLKWHRLVPLGNSNGSGGARDEFVLAMMLQPGRLMEELPLNWRGEGAYAERVKDMNLGKLLDVIGCLCETSEREASTIVRVMEDFESRPDSLYLALSGDVFRAGVEFLAHLSVFWECEERGPSSDNIPSRDPLKGIDLEYISSDNAKRDKMAYRFWQSRLASKKAITKINAEITRQAWDTAELSSHQGLKYSAERWREKCPELLSPLRDRVTGRPRTRNSSQGTR